MKYVRKRDGRLAPFDGERIVNAIWKAVKAVGEGDRSLAEKLGAQTIAELKKRFGEDGVPTVEEIQDIVEKVLIENSLVKVAKAYILYRKQHQDLRELAVLLSQFDLVEHYINIRDWRVRENSNMSYSLQGLNSYLSSTVIAKYWLGRIYPPEASKAHTEGDLHIHDLGVLGPYCVGWDLLDLLLSGFGGVPGKISSTPAKHFRTALGQVVNFFYTLQGESAGAQAFSNFDTYLAPFIYYDKLSYREVRQAIQEFLFNMNVPTRVGFQSLAYDTPVFVKRQGKIEVVEIGKLVEEEFGKNRERIIPNVDGYGNPSKDSFAVIPNEECEVLGFDSEGRVKWLKVKAFIKHRVPNRKFIRLISGNGEVRISRAHSLFKLENKKISSVTPMELKTVGSDQKLNSENHILAIRTLNGNILGNKDKLDLFELVKELPSEARRRIFVVAENAPQTFSKIKGLYAIDEFLRKTGISDKADLHKLVENEVLPFDLYMTYADEILEDAKLYIKTYPEKLYERFLGGERLKDFVKLTSWYINKGKANRSGIVISEEKDKINDVIKIVRDLGLKYSISRLGEYNLKDEQDTETERADVAINGLYAHILPYLAGVTSREKTVPFLIFDLNENLRKVFLDTLFEGDGCFSNSGWNYSSVSDKLLSGVSLLCIANGWKVRVVPRNTRRSGTLLIYKKTEKENEIQIGDLEGIPVYEIDTYEYNWEWEYDISVDSSIENFVGGVMVLFHNTPFTNLTFDLRVPEFMRDEPVIVSGKVQHKTYGEMEKEMEMLNLAFAEVMAQGDAQERIFTFPIPTYNITKDFDWNSPIVEKVFEIAAKYGAPYFANFVNSDMKPEDVRSMCCRLRIDNRELRKRGGGYFGANPLTGSLGVITINMPRIGYLSKNEDEFFERLERMMDIAKSCLEVKRKVLERFIRKGLYPYSRRYLRGVEARFGCYWKNHFSTIGLIGVNEALLNMFGFDIAHPEGLRFAVKILKFMRTKLVEFQEETGNLYNLEATPAEGTSYRLARIDKKKYPDIIVANEKNLKNGAAPFYTNSTHLPVDYEGDLFEALEHQDNLQPLYTGGTVFHIYLGERVHSWKAAMDLIRKIAWNSKIPYFTLTPTFSICPSHGYLNGENNVCPICGAECEVYSRVVGYFRPVSQWNDGKQSEFSIRRTYEKSVKLATVPSL